MKAIKKYGFWLLLIALPLQAQEKWTLEQCLDYALKNNIQVKKTQLSQQSAQINLNQAKNNRLPSVNGSVSANMNNGSVINQITNQRMNQTA